MDAKERYFWDLNGYLVAKGVMSPAEIDEANEIVDRYSGRIQVGGSTAKDSKAYAGTGRPMLHGILEFPEPDCDPFRRMLAHPAVVSRLRVMCEKGFRLDHGPMFIVSVKGTAPGTRCTGTANPIVHTSPTVTRIGCLTSVASPWPGSSTIARQTWADSPASRPATRPTIGCQMVFVRETLTWASRCNPSWKLAMSCSSRTAPRHTAPGPGNSTRDVDRSSSNTRPERAPAAAPVKRSPHRKPTGTETPSQI